jgi:nucleolin
VPRQQVTAMAMQIGKANKQPTGVLPLSRYFSQTMSVAYEEKDGDRFVDEAVDNAVEAAENPGEAAGYDSTPIREAPLQSSQTEGQRAEERGGSIYISNMTFDATEAHLQEAFSKYGEIVSANVGRDGRGLSRGFGFVTFATKEAANRAVEEANDSFWHGRRINVNHRKSGVSTSPGTRSGEPKAPTNSLYIGNIPYETSDAELNQMFRSLDNVTDVRVAVDRNTGWPRGFAHADFTDLESAQRAFEVLSKTVLSGRNLRIDYADNRKKSEGSYTGNSRNIRGGPSY